MLAKASGERLKCMLAIRNALNWWGTVNEHDIHG